MDFRKFARTPFKDLTHEEQEEAVQDYVLNRDVEWLHNVCCEVVKKEWLVDDEDYVQYYFDEDATQTGE
jgi:hypothetical protein